MRRLLTMIAFVVGAFIAPQAHAAPINLGFETGDSTGWLFSAPEFAVTTSKCINGFGNVQCGSPGPGDPQSRHWTPYSGTYFAYINAGWQGANVYSTLTQTFTANAGDQLNLAVLYDSADYRADDSYVKIIGTSTSFVLYTMNTFITGAYGGSGWTPLSFAFPANGTYTLEAGIRNTGDNTLDSTLGLDAPSSVPPPPPPPPPPTVPEPASLLLLGTGLLSAARRVLRLRKP